MKEDGIRSGKCESGENRVSDLKQRQGRVSHFGHEVVSFMQILI